MSAPRHRRLLAAICLGILALVATASAAPRPAPTLLAVGDVASCDSQEDERVAELVSRTPGTIALLGDIVYDNGTADEFTRCFMPAWAPMLPRIRAALGNHEYANGNSDAAAARAILRLSADAWYSYDVGAWHVVVLNSNCTAVGGCHAGSRQWQWLRRDLRRHRTTLCTLAYWHHPRFSSGEHGSDVAFVGVLEPPRSCAGRRRPGGPRPRLRTLCAHRGYQVVRGRDRRPEPAGIRPGPCGERRAAEHVLWRPPARAASSRLYMALPDRLRTSGRGLGRRDLPLARRRSRRSGALPRCGRR